MLAGGLSGKVSHEVFGAAGYMASTLGVSSDGIKSAQRTANARWATDGRCHWARLPMASQLKTSSAVVMDPIHLHAQVCYSGLQIIRNQHAVQPRVIFALGEMDFVACSSNQVISALLIRLTSTKFFCCNML